MQDQLIKLQFCAARFSRRHPVLKPAAKLFHTVVSPFIRTGKLPSVAEAENLLQSLSPDPATSVLCENEQVSQNYDLQIIVPVYNVERYIARCLDSVFSQQTKYSYLLVVINDGSPDHSGDIIARYAHHPNLKVITQENRGFSGARNRGLEQLYARYVMFLDSDDQLCPGAIESLLSTAYRTGADIVQGGFERVLEDHVHSRVQSVANDTASAFDMKGFPWGKVYKADLFRRVHFPTGYWYEDTLMAMILYPMAKHFATVDDYVYGYTINPTGITATSKGKAKSIDSYYITRSLLKDATTLGLQTWTDFQLNHFFSQLFINYLRTFPLGSAVRKAIFVLSCELARQLPQQTGNRFYTALINHDFARYEWHCQRGEL